MPLLPLRSYSSAGSYKNDEELEDVSEFYNVDSIITIAGGSSEYVQSRISFILHNDNSVKNQ